MPHETVPKQRVIYQHLTLTHQAPLLTHQAPLVACKSIHPGTIIKSTAEIFVSICPNLFLQFLYLALLLFRAHLTNTQLFLDAQAICPPHVRTANTGLTSLSVFIILPCLSHAFQHTRTCIHPRAINKTTTY